MPGDRLTWEQIRAEYPEQWVALRDVKYMDDDGINVESAVVICAMDDSDYAKKRLAFMREGREYEYERTADTRGFMGEAFPEPVPCIFRGSSITS